MSVLAVRGGARLVDDGDGMGHIESGNGIGPTVPVDAILKWGYWQVPPVMAASVPMEGEEPLIRKYEQVLQRNAIRCSKNYQAASRVTTAAGAEQNRNPQLSEILDAMTLQDSTDKALAAARKKLANEAAAQMALELGISFAAVSPYVRDLVAAQAGVQAERITAGVRDIVANIILDSITQGWDVPQTASQIYEQLVDAKPWQATMLARTDLVAMKNGGSFAAASVLAESAPVFKRWKNADDEKVRPTHVEAEDQVVKLDAPFTVGGAQLMYPGDPAGPDNEVINCRCTLVYTDDPAVMVSAGWDESKHPRHPEGSSEGGKFAPKGEELFQSEPEDWSTVLSHQAEMEQLWEEQKYRDLASANDRGIRADESVRAKIGVQDKLAAKLNGDADFKSLVRALDPYEDWKQEFEPGGSMATADTVEKQTAALAVANWARSSGDSDAIALQFQLAAEQEFGLEPNEFIHKAWEETQQHYADAQGMTLEEWQAQGPEATSRELFTPQQMAGARKFVRAQYDLTQQMFKDAGITHVYAYRGMKFGDPSGPAGPPGAITESLQRGADQFISRSEFWEKDDRRGTPPKQGDYPGMDILSVHQNPLSSWAHSFNSANSFANGNARVHSLAGTKIDVRRVLSTPFTGFGCLDEDEMVVLGGTDMDAMVWSWFDGDWSPPADQEFHLQWTKAKP